MYSFERPTINLTTRILVAIGFGSTVFLILLARLWYLQVVKGDHFRVLSENNRRRVVYIPPPRGQIFDRHGRVIVRNRPAFNIEFVTEESPDPEGTLNKLAEILSIDRAEIDRQISRSVKRRRYEPKIVLKDVDRDVLGLVRTHGYELPGVLINYYPARDYLYDDFAAHVIGYIREITKDQLDSSKYPGYQRGDLIGQFGVEAKWEHFLQGQRGKEQVIVNARGIRIPSGDRSLQIEKPGHNITLTLDFDAQDAADSALRDKKGAVVALNPATGEVLAMSSAPRFDPNIFTGEISAEQWTQLVAGPQKPMSNRAVQGGYPPGSVFKAIMGVAGLNEQLVSPSKQASCRGFLHFGNRNYHCHKRTGHGAVNLQEALIVSCDVYFYELGISLGVDRIHEYATQFGLGSPTGLNLVRELPGIVPSTKWKKKRFAGTPEEKWYPGETLSVAIGQGALQVTPLQMAVAVSAILNGGQVLEPNLIKEIWSNDSGFKDAHFPKKVIHQVDVNPQYLEIVRQGLIGVVNDPRGTGARARLPEEFGIQVGGKTGTSQVVSLEFAKKGGNLDHHAWFVGFAPATNPEIVVAVIIENGGHGGVAAAPVAQQVMQAYFRNTRPELAHSAKEQTNSGN